MAPLSRGQRSSPEQRTFINEGFPTGHAEIKRQKLEHADVSTLLGDEWMFYLLILVSAVVKCKRRPSVSSSNVNHLDIPLKGLCVLCLEIPLFPLTHKSNWHSAPCTLASRFLRSRLGLHLNWILRLYLTWAYKRVCVRACAWEAELSEDVTSN